MEILSYKKVSHSDKEGGSRVFEDHIKSLLQDLEDCSKKHIKEINDLHEHYRHHVIRAKELEEKINGY